MGHNQGMGEELVWYAAYGSNVDRRRFLTYLTGGPVPGTTDVQAGSRDPSPPRGDEPFRFNRPIRFAHYSSPWNGATAVLDHDVSSIGALGRRYLITLTQFADVVAQENRRDVSDIPISELAVDEVYPVGDLSYDGLLKVGSDGGTPIVTFTHPSEPRDLDPAPPSPAYLQTLARGISDSHDLSPAEIAHHLHDAPGIRPVWSIDRIQALIE